MEIYTFIDLRLFISPVHAYLLEAMRVMGLWPIFEHNDSNRAVPNDFGVQLKSGNLEERLAKIRINQIKYQETHRKEIEKIEQIGKDIRNSENNVPAKNFRSMIFYKEMNQVVIFSSSIFNRFSPLFPREAVFSSDGGPTSNSQGVS